MSNFNVKKPKSSTDNKKRDQDRKVIGVGGGEVIDPKSFIKLHSLLTTNKLNSDRYYSTVSQDIHRIADAVKECVHHNGALFTAKLIVMVRSQDGNRSSTHVAAGELMQYLSGKDFARAFLKAGLLKCTERQQQIFKRMYSHKDIDKNINAVVDDMTSDQLDWAMQQVQRTVEKNA